MRRVRGSAFSSMPEGLTIERITLAAGFVFVIVNVFVLAHYMPGHELHQHHTQRSLASRPVPATASKSSVDSRAPAGDNSATSNSRRGTAKAPSRPRTSGRATTAPQASSSLSSEGGAMVSGPASSQAKISAAAAEEPRPGAPTVMARWLAQCAQRPRCACLQHGLGAGSEELFASFPTIAFFVLLTGPPAQQLASRLAAANLSHVYVLRADLQTRGSSPMANDVLNPAATRLTALQALRVSNEFFDLQLVHASSPQWLLHPTRPDARAVLSLSAATLLLLPSDSSQTSWKRALAAVAPLPLGGAGANEDDTVAALVADDAVAATSRMEATLAAEGCEARQECSAGDALRSLRDAAASFALLVESVSLRRLNAHHYSCWHSPRCHQRMYVMDLPRAPPAPPASSALSTTRRLLLRGWMPRVPLLYRVDDGTRFGAHNFSKLSEAWALRGKDLGFSTGGMNLDTAIGLQLAVGARARLAAQFLALPVGRDMMLWNIIIGKDGLYAIDQEGHAFEDGAVPWGDRVWPYCISVRDCYEKALGALCGRQRPTQPLPECFAPLMRAEYCPDSAQPFPCPNGCQASFLDCKRRMPKEVAFIPRKS